MIPALYRNFLVANVTSLPIGIPERRKAFEALKTPVLHELGRTYPYNRERYVVVTAEAKRLSKDLSELTKKTRFCSRKKCDTNVCGFAHDIDEWNAPFCLQQEFCLKPECDKNHGLTKAEYVELNNITVPEKKQKISLECTQFCRIMKECIPCNVKGCTFAHSLWEYKPMMCFKDDECTDAGCVKKHTKDSIFHYMEKQGVPFPMWMLRSANYNNSDETKRRSEQSTEEAIQWTKDWSVEFKKYEDELDLANSLKHSLKFDETPKEDEDVKEDEDEEDKEEDAVVFHIGGKDSIMMSTFLKERHFEQFVEDDMEDVDIDIEDDNESEDEDCQLSDEESANVMLAAVDLGLDFDTAFDMINSGKSALIFVWHKRRFCM